MNGKAKNNAYGCTPYVYRKNPKPMQLYDKQNVIFLKTNIDEGVESVMDKQEKVSIQKAQQQVYEKHGKNLLNILNGQCMYDSFRENNLMEEGIYIPFNEAMCVGQASEGVFSEEFITCRCESHNVTLEQYREVVLKPLQGLFERQYDYIAVWFGDDMFCQINLLTVLAYLDEINYSGKIVFHLVRETIKEFECFEVEIQGYKEIYRQAMLYRQLPSNVPLPVMYKGVKLYLEYLKDENEITSYIKKHGQLKKDLLLQNLFQRFSKYGLGDIQYLELIKKCEIDI